MTNDLKAKVAKVAESYGDESIKILARAILAACDDDEARDRELSEIVRRLKAIESVCGAPRPA